jgi:hypothetical protein
MSISTGSWSGIEPQDAPSGQTTVTEVSAKKIVVTTTIRLDADGDGNEGAASEALQVLASTGAMENAALQRMVSDGRLVMMRIAPRTFLGLTRGRRRIQPLRIDDHLFIFAPRQDSLRSLADLVASLLRSEGLEAGGGTGHGASGGSVSLSAEVRAALRG